MELPIALMCSETNLSVNAGTFSDVYNIRFHSKNFRNNVNSFSFLIPIDEFYKPVLGFKIYKLGYSFKLSGIFELIDYDLKINDNDNLKFNH
jgi:hypothetical protein